MLREKLIDIKNITYEYFRRDAEGDVREMIEAVKDVSIDVAQGEFIAIVGKNGSGKSTLAKHINALLCPSSGEVVVDGVCTDKNEEILQIRRAAGMVFQNPDNQIVGNIVEEDIAFGPENLGVPTADIWNRVEHALEETETETLRALSPNHLSGGQKQRVAIAGVLAMQPKCIIFDEATAMLDPQGRKRLLEVAKRLQTKKNITIILITHHMDEVLAADRVFVMHEGRLEMQGTPKEIFREKALLEKCGLGLPVFYQYLDFIRKHQILSGTECDGIASLDELLSVMGKQYKAVQGDNLDGILKNNVNDFEKDGELWGTGNKNYQEGFLLNHVSYTYNEGYVDEKRALEDVSLHIGKGEFVAVIGHTGSGKSTLMQLLNGLYLPTGGNVYYNGQDITDKEFSIKRLRQKVGLIFQHPEYQLFAETVEKEVCFGPENMDISKVEAQKRAYEAIAEVGLPDSIYDCSPFQLSGGQKRRVAIASVLAMQPEFLVLDEPTAGLDPSSANMILRMLKRLQREKGMGIVLVSHSMEEVAEYADRIIVMHHGRKYADGQANKIFSQVEEMEQIGLSVPMGNKILHTLKKVGNRVETDNCSMTYICEQMLCCRNSLEE